MSWQENYERRTKEANVDYWQEKGFLDGITDPHVRMVTALMLQNQMLMDHASKDSKINNGSEIISKVIPNLLAHKIVSVQPKLGPNDLIYYTKWQYKATEDKEIPFTIENVVESMENLAKARKLKEPYDPDVSVDKLAGKLVQEINNEILADIDNNCGTIITADSYDEEKLHANLCNLSGVIHRKTLVSYKKWIVISEETAKEIPKVLSWCSTAYDVHVVKGWNRPGIIMGQKGENFFDSSYAWCPYIMLTKIHQEPDPEFLARPRYLIRYGKCLQRSGQKYFGKIKFEGV
jgi:hypothetical protein